MTRSGHPPCEPPFAKTTRMEPKRRTHFPRLGKDGGCPRPAVTIRIPSPCDNRDTSVPYFSLHTLAQDLHSQSKMEFSPCEPCSLLVAWDCWSVSLLHPYKRVRSANLRIANKRLSGRLLLNILRRLYRTPLVNTLLRTPRRSMLVSTRPRPLIN